MSRELKEGPETLEEAVYLLDRGRLPAELQDVVAGAQTRQQAVHKLTDEFDSDEEGEFFGDEYEDQTNEELREELGNRGLETDGKKADLVKRLREDDAQPIE